MVGPELFATFIASCEVPDEVIEVLTYGSVEPTVVGYHCEFFGLGNSTITTTEWSDGSTSVVFTDLPNHKQIGWRGTRHSAAWMEQAINSLTEIMVHNLTKEVNS